ncbi:MAG: hypothetical protein ABJE47_03265 [bacterium]
MDRDNVGRGERGAFGLVLAWIAVGAPLLWGVSQTVVKSLALMGR